MNRFTGMNWLKDKIIYSWLLHFGADPNISIDQMCWTALHYATYVQTSALWNYGANLNERDKSSSTFLYIAVRYQYKRIQDMLCTSGADPEVKDFLGLKPGNYCSTRNICTFNSIVSDGIEDFHKEHMENSAVDRCR